MSEGEETLLLSEPGKLKEEVTLIWVVSIILIGVAWLMGDGRAGSHAFVVDLDKKPSIILLR